MGELTLADFRLIVASKAEVLLEGGAVGLDIMDLEELPANSGFERFTLQLRGSLDLFLPQGTYSFRHDLIRLEPMFLVPIGRQQDGYLYEIAFHRKTIQSEGA